ncbi:glycosyltransferase family 2 protein [Kitasatospora griseola]|uniref:glycosyltransferase family 2 protein n=1 Tax=Kitasatospora griseola TaxID=2064 RepID=UPI0016717A23|nr:glycosyltransferase family 2 protein [Kitasatospora griseola]GGR05340.1 integral membrane regulatory protein [Kitasatospora griseola]
MTVYSHQSGFSAARPPAYPRHLVTAVIVSHDGARWLPQALAGLLGQDRQVQRILAVDTGSTDNSPQLLADTLGDWLPDSGPQILGRRVGFGRAVGEAVFNSPPLRPEDLTYSLDPSGYDPVTGGWDDFGDPLAHEDDLGRGGPRETRPVEWLWLLHDDCEPQTDALRRLLQVADSTPTAAVVGPKLRSWYDRRQLLEVGVSIARSGRRWTGLDRREQDQGQHDQVRPVLAVSTAGMLVRRDVFEELGGFDKALPLMRDDTDFCWRVNAAGHRVVVAPDAVLRHAEAASRERRAIDCGPAHPHRVDKAGAVYTLLANSKGALFPYVLLRLILGTITRVIASLVGKDPRQAYDEIAGLGHELLRLPRLMAARARRRKTRSVDSLDDRTLFPAPGATVRLAVENVVGSLGIGGGDDAGAGRHGSVESGPGEDDTDDLVVEQFALLKKLVRRPAPVLFAALLLFALVACRNLIGSGFLQGGALLPAGDGAAGLWNMFADPWHPVGTGSTATAPPYLGVLAVLSWLLFGHADLALTLIVVLSVPLAAVSAYLVSRPLIASKLVRAWASATYALLPAATGALAQGRIGTAVLAVLLPPLARAAAITAGLGIRKETAAKGARPGWRSAWMTVLMLTVITAFVPLVWAIAVPLCLAALVHAVVRGGAFGSGVQAVRLLGLRVAVILGVPVLVLAPWSIEVLTHPSRLLLEAGVPGFSGPAADPLGLVLVNPGGAGVPPVWLSAGVVLSALAALLRADRRRAVLAAWGAAAAGLVFSVVVAGTTVTPASGGSDTAAWAGPATLLAGVALLAAAAIGADGANARVSGIAFGWRQPVAALVLAFAVLAPVGTAAWWAIVGADGPLRRDTAAQVPAFIAEAGDTTDRSRTLMVTGDADGTAIRYALVRGAGLTTGQAEGTVDAAADQQLGQVTAKLLAGSGGDLARTLAGYGVSYIQVKDPVIGKVRDVLDTTPGVIRLSLDHGIGLWQVSAVPGSRAQIVSPGAVPVVVPSGAHDIWTTIPAGPADRQLRLAEQADSGWQATLDGKPLKAVTLDGWAQGFQLPAEGGRLDVTRTGGLLHTGWAWAQLALGVVVLVLALPGRRNHNDDDLPEEVVAAQALAAAAQAQAPAPGSRRARRLAERGEGGDGDDPQAEPGVYTAGVPAQQAGEPEPAPAYRAEPEPFADPYQADPYQADPYQADPYQQQGYQSDGYGYDYTQQQPVGAPQQPETYDQYGQQPGYGYDTPPAQGWTDPYAAGYPQQQDGQQQAWLPEQQQPTTYYDPNDPYGGGHHPQQPGTGS